MPTNRRTFIKSLALGALGASLQSCISAQVNDLNKPKNVLLLMADDLNTTLSPWGHSVVQTPNMELLAKRGVRFSRAYCPYPLCGPSRTALLTGNRPETFPMGINEVDWRASRPDAVTLPEIARQQGLKPIRYGKISHQGMPEGSVERDAVLKRGGLPHTHFDPVAWDEEFGDFPGVYERKAKGEEQILAGNPHGGVSLHTMRVENREVLPDQLTADHAIAFLNSERASQPFFLGVGFMKPHVPLFAPEEFWLAYDKTDIEALLSPSSLFPPGNLPPGALLRQNFHRGLDRETQRHLYRGYLASVSWMDDQLGRVLQALQSSGQWENTLIIFVADHGYQLGQQGQWDKMMMFEPSLHIPLIFAGAGIEQQGTVCPALIESLDIFPTVCNLMDWPVPENHGTDLTPWLRNPDLPSDRPVYAWVHAGSRQGWSIRNQRYRYSVTSRNDSAGDMLFDLHNDPEEMNNLAGDPDSQAICRELYGQLQVKHAGLPAIS